MILKTISIICLVLSVTGSHADYTKFFERCTKEKNTLDCLKQKAIDVLERAAKDDSVYILNDYVSIVKDHVVVDDVQRSSNNDNNNTNNDNYNGNVTGPNLDDKLDQKFNEFLSSRSIKLTIPGAIIEGRGKKNKGGYGGALMIGGLAMAGVMAQLAFGKIAFLAGTALLTAKIALVLSAIIGLKKLVGSHGGGHEVIYATASDPHSYGGGYGGWQRSLKPST